MMNNDEVRVFALNASGEFGKLVSQNLGIPLSAHEEREFEDGEHKARPLVNVRGCDVFIIHSLYGDPQQSASEKLCRLLFFMGALKDASAERITAIVPYLCYARKDRKTKPRDPVTTRYVACLFEAIGCDRVVTLDVHNLAAFQNAFRCPTEHLEAKNLFVDYFAPLVRDDEIVVVSPDVGGAKRAEQFRQALSKMLGRDIPTAFIEKYRSGGAISGEAVVGEIRGRVAIVIDDLISSGSTLARAATACRNFGATKVYAAATHGVFAKESNHILTTAALDKIAITNTIPPFRLAPELLETKLAVLDMTPLFAQAIQRIHEGGSLVELLEL